MGLDLGFGIGWDRKGKEVFHSPARYVVYLLEERDVDLEVLEAEVFERGEGGAAVEEDLVGC
jgi:hypothetical protein